MKVVFNYPGVTNAEGRQRVLELESPPEVGKTVRFEDDDRLFMVADTKADDQGAVGVRLDVVTP